MIDDEMNPGDHGAEPSLPWVFGPEGYAKRPALTDQYEKKEDIGADSPPEVMIARALAYRASELTKYAEEFDDNIFSSYAMNVVSRAIPQYVEDMGISFSSALDEFLNRIDDGGWDDSEILNIAKGEVGYLEETQGPAGNELNFEKHMKRIVSEDVSECERTDKLKALRLKEEDETTGSPEEDEVNAENTIHENQEGVDPSPPTKDELVVMFDELKVPAQEQSKKIEHFLRKFTEDAEAAAEELRDMFADAGETALDAVRKKVNDSLSDSTKDWLIDNIVFPNNPTPPLPLSTSSKSVDEGTKNTTQEDVRQLIREILENSSAHDRGGEALDEVPTWRKMAARRQGRPHPGSHPGPRSSHKPGYGEGNLTISDVQELFPSLSPGEQDDIWEKYKHLNNAGELKAAILGL